MDISGPTGRRVAGGAVALLIAGAVACVAAVVVTTARDGSAPSAGTTPASAVAVIAPSAARVGLLPAVGSLAVLRDWDRARARAWQSGDTVALQRLYADGSRAGRHDVAMLRRWTDRGWRVEGLRMQVLAVTLRARTARRLVLVVTDRLADAEAVRTGRRTRLPNDLPTTRRLEFRRSGGPWRLASVEETVQEIPRPASSTDRTSGSENS